MTTSDVSPHYACRQVIASILVYLNIRQKIRIHGLPCKGYNGTLITLTQTVASYYARPGIL
jgi:hypothetical protein